MVNRHGLVVEAKVTQPTRTTDREVAVDFVDALGVKGQITLGADIELRHAGIRGGAA